MVSKIKVDEIEASQGSNITVNSTVKVDTINESTTASGVTIDGVLIKDGQVDGVDVSAITNNPAFDVVDVWVQTADLTAVATPITANLSQFTSGIATTIGTGMSVSSGIWTFPQTGIWRVTAQATTRQATNSVNAYIYIRGSNDNFSSDNILALQYHHGPTTNIQKTQTCTTFVDIQDTTTDKVRFDFGGFSGSNFKLYGWAGHFGTGFIFERIANT